MAAAYSARQLGVPATIVVPSVTPIPTVERLKDEGATVIIHGNVSKSYVLFTTLFTLIILHFSFLSLINVNLANLLHFEQTQNYKAQADE